MFDRTIGDNFKRSRVNILNLIDRLIILVDHSTGYTTTSKGPCSSNCGPGSLVVVTLSCNINPASALECNKEISSEACKLRDCPSKFCFNKITLC